VNDYQTDQIVLWISIGLNVVALVVLFSKGRYAVIILSLAAAFLSPVAIFGMYWHHIITEPLRWWPAIAVFRLAKPSSIWADRFYDGPKMQLARERYPTANPVPRSLRKQAIRNLREFDRGAATGDWSKVKTRLDASKNTDGASTGLMNDSPNSPPIAGKSFSWQHIAGYYLRVHSFVRFAKMSGDTVGRPFLGAYGLMHAVLPNPDVSLEERIVGIPIEHKSDYKSVYRAHLDSSIESGVNEVVVLYEYRRGLFGSRKPCIHVACYPTGTWQGFFEAVSKYAPSEFRWPKPLFLYAPTPSGPFPLPTKGLNPNIFSP
jgi:hypothetical protein